MAKRGTSQWYFDEVYQGDRDLPDPRIPIARHIGWSRTFTPFTEFTWPEPDNYNMAFIAAKPYQLEWIQYQVTFKDPGQRGWITVLYVPKEQELETIQWMAKQGIQARWHHHRPSARRARRPMLWTKSNSREITLNELLLLQNKYDFLYKYFSQHQVDQRLGQARADLEMLHMAAAE